MRSVDKGFAPSTYTQYKDARNDLADRIGWFCSYCEMPVRNMIEIEHVHPTKNGGNELDWNNFLLSCRYCNGNKKNKNLSRSGYLWPDVDNTTLAFEYSELDIIKPSSNLSQQIENFANSTIDLMGLNRTPHSGNKPTDRDSRWIARISAIGVIEESYNDWNFNKTQEFANQIARTATGHGFYSFWMIKFINETMVIDAINIAFENTYQPQYHINGNLKIRTNGSF